MEEISVMSGYVEHIVYRNPSNGYSVVSFVVDEEQITLVGSFQSLDEGECLEVKGQETSHPLYGMQFKVISYEQKPLEDVQSIKRYLASGAIKGIGKAMAERIVKRFGDKTFYIMENEPERLMEIKGISERKAREIAKIVEDKKEMKEAFMFLQGYGISNTLAIKIYETYHDRLYQIIKENPYKLAEDIQGIGFVVADEIARKVGHYADSQYRIGSGLQYVLVQSSYEGHTYLPVDTLIERGVTLLQVELEQVKLQLQNLAIERKVVIKGEKVYSIPAYYAELNCARMLVDLNKAYDGKKISDGELEGINKQFQILQKENDFFLDELQKQAIIASLSHGIFILTGGPGTGKTTTINMILKYYEGMGMDFALAAPTGRAAKRMTEATGYEARTIHRLLELNGSTVEDGEHAIFERNENNPLEIDLLIIDEMSMVDIFLFHALLKAISIGTKLILVGDRNQLPSVGPGRVLNDLIDSETFCTVELTQIFRQEMESQIVQNAHRIYEGKHLILDNKSMDFFFLKRDNHLVIYKHMIQLITEKLPKYVDATSFDIQVLTPMKKGFLGAIQLNKVLQEYLNPKSVEKQEYEYGDQIYRKGDKVMQIKNNYKIEWEIISKYGIAIDHGLGVFNGDMGIIKEINHVSEEVIVEFDDMRQVKYPFNGLDELELAYAITIHKSQGSEYPAVLIPILTGPKMLMNRNLLYTAITRAKKCVTILGMEETLNEMVDNVDEHKRYASLKERIEEIKSIDGVI